MISRAELGFTIGKAILVRDVKTPKPVLIIATGVTTQRSMEAADELEKEGIHARVLHMHTIKPLDTKAILQYAADSSLVMTVEEHTLIGGLGSAVAECLLDNNQGNVAFKRLGIPDVFAKHYGGQDDLMRTYGLQPDQIAQSVRDCLNGKTNVNAA